MSAPLAFTKMSGAGNDFIVIDDASWRSVPGDRAAWVRAVCRRGVSVGADGVLVVSPEGSGRVRVVFFNPDGGEAFCGNGSRCAARYAVTRGHVDEPTMILATATGDVPAIVADGLVSLTLPPPVDRGEVVVTDATTAWRGRWVVAGVPHLVVRVSDLVAFPLEQVAPGIRRHASFAGAGTNVDFVETDAAGRVHVRTYERGVEGETLACGTGAVAAAFAERLDGAAENVVVVPRSGLTLSVTLPGDPARPDSVRLTGDARFVFEGVLDPEAIVPFP